MLIARSFGGSGNNELKYVPTSINGEGREVAEMDPNSEEGCKRWSNTIVGFQMNSRDILNHLKRMWRLFQLEEVIVNQIGLYVFNFKSKDGMEQVTENGPWLVDNKPLFVKKWEPGLCMSWPEMTKVPIWVKIYDIPLEAWNVEGVSRIASKIGVPIIMDKVTTSIYEKSYGRASFASVLIEVDAVKWLVDSVEVWYKSLGKSLKLWVEYAWFPPILEHCKIFLSLCQ